MAEETAQSEQTEEQGEKKNKKINQMTLQEIDSALKKTQEHMKGTTSKYAKALLARKETLASK